MGDSIRNEEGRPGAADDSEPGKKGKRSPHKFGDTVDAARTGILRDELNGGAAQPQIEDAEITENDESDGEDPIAVWSQATNDKRNRDHGDNHGDKLAGQIEDTIANDEPASGGECGGHEVEIGI